MSRFPDLGHWMLQSLSGHFELEMEDIGKDALLKKNGIVLETESYKVKKVGHFCILRMNALLGLMKMETVVLAATEKDLPLLNLDRISVLGKETQIVELYDTQLSPWSRADAFQRLKDQDSNLPDAPRQNRHWYDDILYSCSYHKVGKGISQQMTKTAKNYAEAFIADVVAAPACDESAKSEKVSQFAENLLSQGGQAVDTITKLFGKETAKRLILHHMYGATNPRRW